MEKTGYIYSSHRLKDIADFVGVTHDISMITPTTPLLVVGLKNAMKFSDFKFTSKQINKNTFWTFGKTEKRVEYEKDLNDFYKFVLSQQSNNIKYYYFNVLTTPYSKVKKLLEIINSSQDTYIYISDDMIYIYYKTYVLGISKTILRYININMKKIIDRLKSNKSNHLCFSTNFLSPTIKGIVSEKKYLIPYFLSLNLSSQT